MTRPPGRPLSLRISVTDRCQLRCLYCTPPDGTPETAGRGILSFEEIVRFVGVVQSGPGLSKVRITGGEPLVRPGIVELVRTLAREGVPDLALTTNGQLLAEMALNLKRAGLHRVNVSLDSLDEGTYARLTRGGDLRAVLEGIEAALRCGLAPVKVNTVVLRGYNDSEVVKITRFGLDRGLRVRFLELMPIGYARPTFHELFVSASEVRARLEERFCLEPLAHGAGETSRDYVASDLHGRRGIIGFVSPETQPFCDGCTRVRLTCTGRLLSCLARGRGPNVRGLLQSDLPVAAELLQGIVTKGLEGKRSRHAFETLGAMAAVGG